MSTRRFLLALAVGIAAMPAAATQVTPPPDDASTAETRRYFTDDPDAPIIAPKGADITIVEYVDYQCPYCRSSAEALFKLMANDKKVRVVFRDWPIFGSESAYAAMIATAAKYQGKYLAAHKALLYAPRPFTRARIDEAVKKSGVDWARLQADLRTHRDDITDLITRNHDQALMLGFTGTPGFIIGNFQSFGGISHKGLTDTVARARARAQGKPSTIRKSRRKP